MLFDVVVVFFLFCFVLLFFCFVLGLFFVIFCLFVCLLLLLLFFWGGGSLRRYHRLDSRVHCIAQWTQKSKSLTELTFWESVEICCVDFDLERHVKIAYSLVLQITLLVIGRDR